MGRLRSANCELILGGGTHIYGKALHRYSHAHLGLMLNLATGEPLHLDPLFPQSGYLMGFDPGGQWVLIQEGAGPGRRQFSLALLDLITSNKIYLQDAHSESKFQSAGETLSKNGRFAVLASSRGKSEYTLRIWDLHSSQKAQNFIVASPTRENSLLRDMLISDSGTTLVAQGGVKKLGDYQGNSTVVWRVPRQGDKLGDYILPGVPKFISSDGNLILTKIFDGEFRLFRFEGKRFDEVILNGQKNIFTELALRAQREKTMGERLRFKSAQYSEDGRLAIEMSYEKATREYPHGNGVIEREYSQDEAILVWHLSNLEMPPILIDKKSDYDFHRQTYRLISGGRFFLVGANNLEVVFLDPIDQKEIHLPLNEMLPSLDVYIWRIEFSEDLQKVAISTNQGVLVLDLADIARRSSPSYARQ